MTDLKKAISDMEMQFSKVALIVKRNCPEFQREFETYCNEAMRARLELEESLKELDPDASILEIGGGILALSFQLSREGFKVSSVEPVGSGFGPIGKLMICFDEYATTEKLKIDLIRAGIEEVIPERKFDFAFSINVMEHVKNPYQLLKHIRKFLKDDACYRFICPNYNFPYEPHFSKFLFQRRNKAFFLPQRRVKEMNHNLIDSEGLYASLNFITLSGVKKAARESGLLLKINRAATLNLFRRAIDDPILRSRHRAFSFIVASLRNLHLEKLITLMPTAIQPVMDVQIYDPK